MTDAAATFSRSLSERFDVGDVIARTFVTLGRNLPLFAGLATLCIVVPVVISVALNVAFGTALQTSNVSAGIPAQGGSPNFSWVELLSLFVYMCSFLYLTITVSGIVISRERGTEAPKIVSAAWRHMLPLAAILLLSGIAISLSCMLLIVPGIVAALALSVVVPARVGEGLGVAGSLERSWTLTRGFRWQIFLVLLVMFLTGGTAGLVVLLLVGAFFRNPVLGPIIEAALLLPLYVAGNILNITATTVIYCEIRKTKEGSAPSEVAAAFS